MEKEKIIDPTTTSQDKELLEQFGLPVKEYKKLKKKLRSLSSRDDKTFMDMLRVVSRNHYTLNQMVDRKARILLSANVLLLSLIIGRMLTNGDEDLAWRFYLLVTLSISCFLSIIFSMLAVLPERTHGNLDETGIRNKEGNPLFFGNFKKMSEKIYENVMLEMVNDRDFVYRSMIQDIYHLGQVLEQKSRYLRISLFIFILGLGLTAALTLFFRYWVATH
ncbi:MAG: Pycsar system effector family protein, partial [Bacteroidota bacterium]